MNIETLSELKKEKAPKELAQELLSKENYGKLMESKGKNSLTLALLLFMEITVLSVSFNVLFVKLVNYISTYLKSVVNSQTLPIMPDFDSFALPITIFALIPFIVIIYMNIKGSGSLWSKYLIWHSKESTVEELEKIFTK